MFGKKSKADTYDRIRDHQALKEYRRLGDDLGKIVLQMQAANQKYPPPSFSDSKQLYAFANTPEAQAFYDDLYALMRKHNVSIVNWDGVYLSFHDRNETYNLRELGFAIDPY